MELECTLCNKKFDKKHTYDIHMKGIPHQNEVLRREELQISHQQLEEDRKKFKLQSENYRKRVFPLYETYQQKMFDLIVTLKQRERKNALNFNESIIYHFECSRPRKVIKQRRHVLCQFVKQIVSEVYPEAQLEVYGSIPLNLDAENSDIDVSIISKVEETELLNTIADAIESCQSPYFKVSRVLQARIPLISIVDTLADNLQLDLSIWKMDKLEISKVFTSYLNMDERVRPLIYAIRSWSKARKINEAYTGWINSFGWTVMAVAYLQIVGVVPLIEQLDLSQEKQDWIVKNTMTPGELFHGFFQWLLDFDYKTKRISIRHGGITDKEADKFTDDTVFCVERPRTPYQNVTRQVSPRTLKVILREWRRVVTMIQSGALFDQICTSSETHKLN